MDDGTWTRVTDRLRARRDAAALSRVERAFATPETPIRMNFWAGEGLAAAGRDLAKAEVATLDGFPDQSLAAQIRHGQLSIRKNYFEHVEAGQSGAILTPAAEWLVDNHHIVEENFRLLRQAISPRLLRYLPTMPLPDGRAVPRALVLAWYYIALTNSDVSDALLTEMVEGYQSERVLTIAELWAIPTFLRFVLLENLRRLSDRVTAARLRRDEANQLADELDQIGPDDDPVALLKAADLGLQDDTFAMQLLYRLSNAPGFDDRVDEWVSRRLAQRGVTADDAIQAEYARQSGGNVTVGNIIGSLKTMGNIDWLNWFEKVSRVDRMLQERSEFSALDQPSRTAYRNTVERIARRSDLTEIEVARRALDSAPENAVGTILLGDGLPAFEIACGYQPTWRETALRRYRKLDWVGIAAPLALFTVMLVALLSLGLPADAGWVAVPLLLLAALPASDTAMGMVGTLAARLVPPSRLPGCDFAKGVPAQHRTIVVIPCLLTDLDTIDELAQTLELHYLANPLDNVSFALLSDWRDNGQETHADDQRLLRHALSRINALADRYGHGGIRRFFLLHRKRLWNPQEGVWMGWERKRGKLNELNLLLRGHSDTTFIDTGAAPPEGVRYVITLDADTRMPRGTVGRLVGKMAHPVNQPVTDPETGVVIKGYGIMQPRVTPSLTTGAESSVYQRVFSITRGLDPYVFTVSDLYQDLLGRGTFTGKGIYDVDAFETAIGDRISENTVLSHDLLEGALARAALVTDVELVEDFPIRYSVELGRQHRWARGDWQLIPFMLDPKNGLAGLARLKMLDNLRRSLVPVCWAAASIIGWWTLPGRGAVNWQLGLVLLMLFPRLLNVALGAATAERGISISYKLRRLLDETGKVLTEVFLRIAFALDRAVAMADAVVRSLYRMAISRRKLLEWTSASEAHRTSGDTVADFARRMWPSVLVAIAAMAVTAMVNPAGLSDAYVIGALWVLAPLAAWAASRTLETEDRLNLDPADAATLRRIARRTWRFFETFVTEQTNHLPPDNYQDYPAPKLAERTSPTNMGLYLMSVMSARDLGWIGLHQAIERIEATMATMERLDRYRGHFFNWYDTRDLRVLPAPYISSVDSGNLAGLLVALSSGLKIWARNPAVQLQLNLTGPADTLAVMTELLSELPRERRALRPLYQRLEKALQEFATLHATISADTQLASVRAINLTVIAAGISNLAADLDSEISTPATAEILWWAGALRRNCEEAQSDTALSRAETADLRIRLNALAERARKMAFDMDFTLLVDPEKKLLSIGYRTESDELDRSCYDLLASEARLTSLFAIAKGDLNYEHWGHLGRPFTSFRTEAVLMSWSGCMFEYLMPPLIMKERQGGILNMSDQVAVDVQIDFGRQRGAPWGVSECAFNARDRDMNYQYYAFGVPRLGLKRVFSNDLVVAPYATLLASQFRPRAAVRNLLRLTKLGVQGPYGFFDAIDFTPSRLVEGETFAIVRNVMAHHHGMSILAVANTVLDGIHRERFHDDPVIQAAELMLQEKAPQEIVPVVRRVQMGVPQIGSFSGAMDQSETRDPENAQRDLAILSDGPFNSVISSTGAGQIMLAERAVNRWRPDPTTDTGGVFLFMKDVQTGDWWSASTSPRRATDEHAWTVFSDHKAEFFKTANGIESRMEVIAATESNAEGRRLTIRNRSDLDREIEVTSYGEIVLDLPASDRAHPAFSKMFVRTEIRREATLIAAERKPRDPKGTPLYLAHLVTGGGGAQPAVDQQAETDRRKFIGRGHSLATAAAFEADARLSGSDGFTLDPIFGLRRRLRIGAGKTASVIFWTIVSDSAEERDRAAEHYTLPQSFDHELRLAWTYSQVQLRHLGLSLEDATLFRAFAALLVYPDMIMSAREEDGLDRLGPQSDLWPMAISGDEPIILIRIDDESDLPIVHDALRMLRFLRARGVRADLVILNERDSSYVQDLQSTLQAMADAVAHVPGSQDLRAHIFPLRKDEISPQSYGTLMAVARISLHTRNGTLAQQLARQLAAQTPPTRARTMPPALPRPAHPVETPAETGEDLLFWNGFGGFSADGREYVVRLRHGQRTPHPWINVIAREDFGFHVSAGGAGFTWAANSRDYQITPWSNDPVCNPVGESILIRDRNTGRVTTPFAALSSDPAARYQTRHGLGYAVLSSETDWLRVEATQLLAQNQPAKLTRLRLTNVAPITLNLECFAAAELVLGNDRNRSQSTIRIELDAEKQALLARNPYATEIQGRVTALAWDVPLNGCLTSRRTWLGHGGNPAQPAAVADWPSPRTGQSAASTNSTRGDPCAVIRTGLSLAPGETRDLVLILADAPADQIAGVLADARAGDAVQRAEQAARAGWGDFLGRVKVTTPDPKFDLMVNTWLPYQALGCRLLARTAFYQASGAFGFRDQLQDASALMLHDPSLARRQILNAAARQFAEGDVQHWWLPATGAGVRTMIVDDVVWLGHITALYLAATGDRAILDEPLPWLTGPELAKGQHDAFFTPTPSEESAPLYEHCARALDLAIGRTGAHGLPLILGGDWNDGMNRVGEEGRGESVWMGWFLAATLDAFIPVAEARGDAARVANWRKRRADLPAALETAGWDGAWYRRGYYDDGAPLGSAESGECQIDSIAQSWALISGVGDPARAAQAADSALTRLLDRDGRFLRLFTPAFDKTPHEPGYIKAYPPGVRENGGQYTHAAAWMVYALGRNGRGSDAYDLFDILNPITHAQNRAAAELYRVEPYVIAADVYGSDDEKRGRGGWTWYTGSAGWMYRAAVEGILGIRRRDGADLEVDPALPDGWPGYTAEIFLDGKGHRVTVTRNAETGEPEVRIDPL
ncbi:GH36-type glycosyl hydrolase domain-containing protein [Paracoccus pacificus]|uniref:GH36-type glycosyl hydrolase domain-containing protein n=1 Tax=Paracoccus pacificus TaxID=1463598 RepID=A0ABW4R3D0_9RHOB